jgi:hypothetical protein
MKKLLLALLFPLFILGCSLRAVAPGNRIAKSSQDFNLQIEEAQNKNLLINVWRAKKRYPLYLTDTSKVTGSLTNTYVLGLSVPFNKPATGTVSPSATFTQNPTFDVNVLNTEDFMRGFLTPVAPAIFAYYLRQGWSPELLIHLMVREISVVGSPGIDAKGATTTIPYYFNVNGKLAERLNNYPDPSIKSQDELEEFTRWARYLAGFQLKTCQNNLLKGILTSDFSALDSATKALTAGLNIIPNDMKKPTPSAALNTSASPSTAGTSKTETSATVVETPNKRSSKVTQSFKGNGTSTPISTAKEDVSEFSKEDAPKQSYNAVVPFDILVDNPKNQAGVLDICKQSSNRLAIHLNVTVSASPADNQPSTAQSSDAYTADQLTLGSKVPRIDTGISRPEDKEASIQAVLNVAESDSGGKPVMSAIAGKPDLSRRIILKLTLRSPEAILYYLGELARLEEYHSFTQRVCINNYFQPVFVAYSQKDSPTKCGGSLVVTDSEDKDVFIPPSCDPNNDRESTCRRDPCGQDDVVPMATKDKVLMFEPTSQPKIFPLPSNLECNSGRSMHSLNLLSQLIALQKSAKDFPATPTVRVIGQ